MQGWCIDTQRCCRTLGVPDGGLLGGGGGGSERAPGGVGAYTNKHTSNDPMTPLIILNIHK